MILWPEKAPIHKIAECGFFLSLGVAINDILSAILKHKLLSSLPHHLIVNQNKSVMKKFKGYVKL